MDACVEKMSMFVKEHDREQERKTVYVCFGVSIVCLIGVQGRYYSFS